MSDESTPAPAERAALRVSIIIPARNAARTLGDCLDALGAGARDDVEVIVVDDGSRDGTRAVARRSGAVVIGFERRRGVAAARNRGAKAARAPILCFLDADVLPASDLLDRGLATMADPAVDAVIGSYDDEPAARSVVSLFKNLAHHHFHQRGAADARTFWGACSFIRRDCFLAIGGFDERRFSISDVELGYRLADGGATIRLDPGLQVKHLKRWTIASLIATDVTVRAIPWTLLILRNRRLPTGLNFSPDQWVAALVGLSLFAAGPAVLLGSVAVEALVGLFGAAVILNRNLYRLFWRKGGVQLAVCGFLLQQLYYLYALVGLLAGVSLHLVCGSVAIEAPWRQRLN